MENRIEVVKQGRGRYAIVLDGQILREALTEAVAIFGAAVVRDALKAAK